MWKNLQVIQKGPFILCIVNSKYSLPLFFFSLGNKDITWAMLEAGAETDVVNSVGRTAAQMAAFVGEDLKKKVLF